MNTEEDLKDFLEEMAVYRSKAMSFDKKKVEYILSKIPKISDGFYWSFVFSENDGRNKNKNHMIAVLLKRVVHLRENINQENNKILAGFLMGIIGLCVTWVCALIEVGDFEED